jgi:four helix bundle protein
MQTFVAYTNALELVQALVPIIKALAKHSADQSDQLERAATSMVLNIAEGARRRGKDPRRFYGFAHGSANEIRAVLDVSRALGWPLDDERARQLLDRELGLLWGLTHRASR